MIEKASQPEALTARSFRRVTLLGATGSIGQSTLSVLDDNPGRYQIYAVSAHRNLQKLEEIIIRYQPKFAVVSCESIADEVGLLRNKLSQNGIETELLHGAEYLENVCADEDCDVVVAAIVGAAGLASTLAAAKQGKQILLANKEAIVMGGGLFMQAVKLGGATLLPVDSEHNAIFQCLPEFLTKTLSGESGNKSMGLTEAGISKLLLTGSGGPFRCLPIDELKSVTPEQACAHPNWDMGQKISVDSATMMNKGLELIEACWLFDCAEADIDIVIHPQSIVHSMVQYKDGSVLAQMGQPDMRTPIAHALAWPERVGNQVQPLDWTQMSDLTFEAPDVNRFPALSMARSVAAANDHSAIVMNAANEILVEAFLQRQIRFDQICEGIANCLDAGLDGNASSEGLASIEQIVAIDHETRRYAAGLIGNRLK